MMTPENAPACKDMNQEDPFGADPGLFADADSGLPTDTDSDLPADMDRGPSLTWTLTFLQRQILTFP